MFALLAAILCNVSPSLALYNFVDRANSDVVFSRQCGLADSASGISTTDFPHHRIVQFGMRDSVTARIPSLCPHIIEVVGSSSEKQMVGIGAFGVVAPMAYAHAIGERAIVQLPRNPMGSANNVLSVAKIGVIHLAVASVLGTSPFPAASGCDDILPKPFSDGFLRPVTMGARSTAILPLAMLGAKDDATFFAGDFHSDSVYKTAPIAAINGSELLTAFLALIILGVIAWLLWWLIDYIGPPEPINRVLRVLLAIVIVIVLINFLLSLIGEPFIVW